MKRILFVIIFIAICIGAPRGAHAQYHITAGGVGDGTSFANAASLNDLQRITQLMDGVGGTVTIYPGRYTNVQAVVAGSGTAVAPLIIQGQASNNPNLMAELDAGSKIIFQPGIARVQITDLRFTNCTDFCIATFNTVNNITIKDIIASNVDRFFEGGQPGNAIANADLLFNNIKIEGFTTSAFRFSGVSRNITFDRVYVQANAADYNGASPSYGAVEFHDTVSDVVIRLSTFIDTGNNVGGVRNPVTDGIWAGPNTNNITITDTFTAGFTDGGIDLSSQRATLSRITSVANRNNLILTQAIANAFTITSLVSMNPSIAHIRATDNDVDTIIATIDDALIETGPTLINPGVPPASWIVDSYRCAIVTINSGVVNHDPARRVNPNGGCPGTEKVTFTNVELGGTPDQVTMPPVPDNTTVGRSLVGDDGGGAAIRHVRKKLSFGLLWYTLAAIIYIMIIHFAMAMRKQFNVQLVAGLFVFGALIGALIQRYEVGFIMAVILSLLFW